MEMTDIHSCWCTEQKLLCFRLRSRTPGSLQMEARQTCWAYWKRTSASVCVCVIQPAHIHRETKPSVLLKAETYTVRQTDMWRNRIERGEWCSLLVADGRGSDTLLLLTTQSTLTEYKTYRPLLISQGAELLHWTNGWNLSCRKGALEKKVEDAVSIKMLSLLFSWAH